MWILDTIIDVALVMFLLYYSVHKQSFSMLVLMLCTTILMLSFYR